MRAGDHTLAGQRGRRRSDLRAQLGPRERAPVALLVDGDDGLVVLGHTGPRREQVLGDVQAGVGEEARLAQVVARFAEWWPDEHAVRSARIADDAAVLPHQTPELGRLVDRPSVERGVCGVGRRPAGVGDGASEAGQPGGRHAVGRRLPEQVTLLHVHRSLRSRVPVRGAQARAYAAGPT